MPAKKPKVQSAQPKDKTSELVNDLKRLQADFINYKARAERERSEAVKLGREMAVTELLPVFDNLERAFAHTPEELKDNTWVKGVNGLEKQLVTILNDLGLQKVEAVGKEFNPETMEAVTYGEGGDVVTEELRAGYILDGKILRPAMVKVGE